MRKGFPAYRRDLPQGTCDAAALLLVHGHHFLPQDRVGMLRRSSVAGLDGNSNPTTAITALQVYSQYSMVPRSNLGRLKGVFILVLRLYQYYSVKLGKSSNYCNREPYQAVRKHLSTGLRLSPAVESGIR